TRAPDRLDRGSRCVHLLRRGRHAADRRLRDRPVVRGRHLLLAPPAAAARSRFVIRRGASVLLALILCSACAANGRAAASPTSVAAPSATPLIDVNDMMGAFPPATFYVLDKDGLKAIALLNHATRYTIPVGKDAQTAAAGAAGRVYVLDQIAEGARIRWFDLDSATERASRVITGASVVGTGIGHGALAIDDSTGIGYALIRENGGIITASFDWFTLKSAGSVFGAMTCPSRILA